MTNKSVLMKLVIVALFMRLWDHNFACYTVCHYWRKGVKDNSGPSLWSSKERPWAKLSIGLDACKGEASCVSHVDIIISHVNILISHDDIIISHDDIIISHDDINKVP